MQQVVLGEIFDTSQQRVSEAVGILNALNILWLIFIIIAAILDRKGTLIFDLQA